MIRRQQRIVDLRPPRIAISLFAAAAAVHLVLPLALLPPSWILGTLVGTAGLALMLRAWWLFRVAGTPIRPTDDARILLTDDVYRLTRNPMYLGMVTSLTGIALLLGSVSPLFVPPLFALFVTFFGGG